MKKPQSLKDYLTILWKEQLPFVVYKTPNSRRVVLYSQNDLELHTTLNLDCDGFVFAPFDLSRTTYFIPRANKQEFSVLEKSEFNSDESAKSSEDEKTKRDFIVLVEKALKEINKGKYKKLVVSRKTDFISSKSPINVFTDLVSLYEHAMVYLWFHPSVGCWLGASPERFLSRKGESLQTEALAGTQPFDENKPIQWNAKEMDEQALVADQVRNVLTSFFPREQLEEHPVITVRAGNLIHLSSLFVIPSKKHSIDDLAKALHPTPAVGGVPKKEAIKFIQKEEGYDRSFYTGFFGLLTPEETKLFVNLRCAQWKEGVYSLYLGAGIIDGSEPEQEWKETQRKAKTILKVL